MSMIKSRTDLGSSKLSNINQIETYAEQLRKPTLYQNASNNELIQQNKKILDILKKIQSKIDKQLEIHRKNMLSTNPHHKVVFNKDQMKLLQEKESNNTKLLTVLSKDLENILTRKKLLQEGLDEKIRLKKNNLEDKISELKMELKRLSQEQKDTQKKLKAYQNISEADYLNQYKQMQEELRIFSAKYVKILTRYTKLTEKLATSAQTEPYFQIPEQIIKNLDVKQEEQYKEYQSIVKLCTILSKRNDSQSSKSNRIYTEKLKELQKTIMHLTELEKSISYKETEILEGKKNIEMIKFKLTNQEKVEKELFRFSQGPKNSFTGQLRNKSYSSVKFLASVNQNNPSQNKLRTRGMSFAKLPNKLRP